MVRLYDILFALSVDPLPGQGITLAVEGASRWNDRDYPDWLADAARSHNQIERDVYRTACVVAGDFWDQRGA